MIEIRKFEPDDTDAAVKIWNEVVDDGVAFPQLDDLDHESGLAFFEEQTYTGIAVDSDTNEIFGFQSLLVTSFNNFIISILVHKNVFCNKISIADEKRVLVIV